MDIMRALRILELSFDRKKPEEILDVAEAFWVYQEFLGGPHALLTSGFHSDGYYNLNSVLQFSNLSKALAKNLVRKLPVSLRERVDVVASSSFAAITFGKDVSNELKSMFVFTEKQGEEQVWTGRFELPADAQVLQVEELITTLGTTKKVQESILRVNPNVKFLEIEGRTAVLTVVHRPSKLVEYPDYKVIPLIEVEIHNWEPVECPLCKDGSVAKRPKPNWQEFRKYMQMKK